jgi:hypothetical protein
MALIFLDGLLMTYAMVLAALALGVACACWLFFRSRQVESRLGPRMRARLLLLVVSSLFGVGLLESGAAACHAWLHQRPRLTADGMTAHRTEFRNETISRKIPQRDRQRERANNLERPKDQTSDPLRLLVIGESSGRGEPYHPWLSVAQIIAWRLERVFPGRRITVDMWAEGGATLEIMHRKLSSLTYRPDALLVYVGHNEFQARYAWMRDVDYYVDDHTAAPRSLLDVKALSGLAVWSPLCRLLRELRDRQLVDIQPPRAVTRTLVDRPLCTAQETASILADFRLRLDGLASFCKSIGTLPVFIIPPANDAGFDPSRSVLAPDTSAQERAAFARAASLARALGDKDPALAIRKQRELVREHPEFAETHYRLARLLEQAGAWDKARNHYIEARECDALPIRCPEPLRRAFREMASRRPEVILVDGPKVLEAKSRHGILDDQFFHDAQHPNLRGYAALAEDLLKQLGARRAFGWPAETPIPVVDVEGCLRHFHLDAARWEESCGRSRAFFHATAYIRFSPKLRKEREAAYTRAELALREGRRPGEAEIPGWPLIAPPAVSHRILPYHQ